MPAQITLPDITDWSVRRRIEWLRDKCTPDQWDMICKRCGVCCLHKVDLRPVFTATAYSTCACEHLDTETRLCRAYHARLKGPGCVKVDMNVVLDGNLLPDSCGYVEFIYGPARVPATVDWSRVRPVSDIELATNKRAVNRIMTSVIPESIHWHVKRSGR